MLLESDCGGGPEPGDERDWKGSWSKSPFLAASIHERAKGWAIIATSAGDERADAFGCSDFVPGRRDQVHAPDAQWIEDLAKSLGRVNVKVGVAVGEGIGDLGNRLDDARFVVDDHDGDQEGVRSDGLGNGLGRDPPASGGREQVDFEAAPLEGCEGFEHGLVFDEGGNDVPLVVRLTPWRESENRYVVALGGATGEDYLLGLGSGDIGDLPAGQVDTFLGNLAVGVRAAASVAELVTHVPHDLFGNSGVDGPGRVIVEIDGAFRAARVVGRGSLGGEVRHGVNRSKCAGIVRAMFVSGVHTCYVEGMQNSLGGERSEAGSSSAGAGEFEYHFPVIRGVQAGSEYYVTMCPLRLIPKLFVFDEEELPPAMRAQRSLNLARVPEMARYIVENPTSWVFSALTASVDAEVRFTPLVAESNAQQIGTLSIPMTATFVINDGQHRRAAIKQALAENPALGSETIAIVMFIDAGLDRCQQMFADLNRYAVRPDKSLSVLYDHRDPMAEIARSVVEKSKVLRDLTDLQNSNLTRRSRKLFTLSSFHTANAALLKNVETDSIKRRVNLAGDFWRIVADQFPIWHQVYRGEATAGQVRADFIHTSSLALHALGEVGNVLLKETTDTSVWEVHLRKLRDIDWHRDAPIWEGRATTVDGKITKGRANVDATRDQILSAIGIAPRASSPCAGGAA